MFTKSVEKLNQMQAGLIGLVLSQAALVRDEAGTVNIGAIFLTLIGVLVVVLFGLILFPIFVSSTITANATTGIGSFAGVSSIIGLIPLLVAVAVLGLVIGGAVILFNIMKAKNA